MEYWNVGLIKKYLELSLHYIIVPAFLYSQFSFSILTLCALRQAHCISLNPTQRLLADIGSIIDSVPGDLLNCLVSFLNSSWNTFSQSGHS